MKITLISTTKNTAASTAPRRPSMDRHVWELFRKAAAIAVSITVIACLVESLAVAQTTIFTDNFNSYSTGTTTSGNSFGSGRWLVTANGTAAGGGGTSDGGVITNGTVATLTNDASVAVQANGRVSMSTPLSGLSGYNTTLDSNSGVLTWTWNMRYDRTGNTPSGFTATSYGNAFILASSTSTFGISAATGYAVLYGNSGNPDTFRLVAFNSGLLTDYTTTGTAAGNALIVGGTATGFATTTQAQANSYYSFKVTYDTTSKGWSFYGQNTGTSAFSDPLTGSYTTIGSFTETTAIYRNTALNYMGGLFSYSTGTPGNTATLDNITLTTSATAAPAQNLSWNTTSGTWNTSATNWLVSGSGSPVAYTQGDNVTFSGTGGGTISLSGSLAPASITVSATSGTYTFVSSDGNLLTGTTGLAKSGGGTLNLSGSNAYTGATAVNGGVLALGNTGALAGTGTIAFGGGTLQYSGSNTVDYSAKIGNSGSAIAIDTNGQNVTFATGLAVSNSGGLTKSGLGTLTLSASNAYTGATAVNGGVLALGNANALAGTGTIAFGGGTLQYSGSNTVDYSAKIRNSGSAIAIDTNGQSVTFATGLAASNSGGLTKSGLGTLTLSASNAYTGATAVNAGVLAYGTSNALSDSTAMTVAGGGLDLGSYTDTVASFAITSGSLVGSGKLTAATYALGGGTVIGNLGAGSMTVTGNSNLNGAADVTSVSLNAGTLTLGSAGRFTSNQVALTGSSGASLSLGGSESVGSLAGGFNVALGSGTLTTGNANTSTTYSGILSGSGGLTKAGNGTFTLAGANTYSGLTTISGGTLALSGSGSIGTGGLYLGTSGIFDLAALASGTYTLPATGDLTGAGTLSGNGKTLAVLGSFAPGNNAGTIAVGTGLSLDLSNSGSSVFEIRSPAYTGGTYDLVSGSGSAVFGGILNLAFSGGSYADGTNVLQIFANIGGRSGNFSAVNATGLGAGQSATFNPTTGFITIVPEPSACASLLTGAGIAAMMRWRKRRPAKAVATPVSGSPIA